jgi:hypothetical protein
VLDVRVLAQKDRKPDDPPGAQLLLQATLPADALAMFDGALQGVLFRKAGSASKQPPLDGVDAGLELTGIGDHVKRLKWAYEQTGCSVEIDYGTAGKRNITLADCRVHRTSFEPRQGGSALVQWTLDAPGLGDATWARLPAMKATDIQMTLHGPEVAEVTELPARGRGKAAQQPAGVH